MKKLIIILTSLFTSVFSVQAVHLSSDNTGEVLIFPYYTVNDSFNTLINLTNTTDQAKALRVRFREAANGREVFAFNLYLAAKDVWSAGLFKGGSIEDFASQLVTNDQSCTTPILNKAPAFNAFYNSHFSGDSQDFYGTDINRTHEGFIEVIEMGVMTGDSAQLVNEFNCQSLNDAWYGSNANNYWVADSTTDMQVASGGLAGDVTLLDVTQGLSITQQPTAINDFSDEILHYVAEDNSPNFTDAKNNSTIISDGQLYSTEWSTGFEAVSSILSTQTLSNEYVLDVELDSKTDWIITMPTRSYHFENSNESDRGVIAPFTEEQSKIPAHCEPYVVSKLFDREQRDANGDFRITPLPPTPPETFPAFCFATSNLGILHQQNDAELPFGIFSSNFPAVDAGSEVDRGYHLVTPYLNGFAELSFDQKAVTNDGKTTVIGLPVIGFSANKYTNSNAQPGLLAQYAGIFPHNKLAKVIQSEDDLPREPQPMKIAEDNVGQVLLYPYYTARKDMVSLITVVNTSDQVKALRVNVLEGQNARSVLDFNLYLGAYDVWVAGIINTISQASTTAELGVGVGNVFSGQDSAQIITNDESCTVPRFSAQQFLPFAFSGNFVDGLVQDMSRVTEGSIEIVEMGTLVGDDAFAATAINSVPTDCQQLVNNWTPPQGQWIMDSTVNVEAPDGSGGLSGSMSILDVSEGLDFSYRATAITDFNHQVIHSFFDDLGSELSEGDNATTLIESDNGLVETTWNSPLEAVTALFMQAEVSNSFAIENFIGAKTEWVNYYPTKQFYVDPLISQSSEALAPFGVVLQEDFGACQNIMIEVYDREANLDKRDSVLPPPDQSGPQHCWSVNVNKFRRIDQAQVSIFGSSLDLSAYLAFNEESAIDRLHSSYSGWGRIDYNFYENNRHRLVGTGANGEQQTIYGLPVIGFTAQAYVNSGAQPGLLANYGVVSENSHKKIINSRPLEEN